MTVGSMLARNHNVLAKACLGGGFAYGFAYTNTHGSSPLKDAAVTAGARDRFPPSRVSNGSVRRARRERRARGRARRSRRARYAVPGAVLRRCNCCFFLPVFFFPAERDADAAIPPPPPARQASRTRTSRRRSRSARRTRIRRRDPRLPCTKTIALGGGVGSRPDRRARDAGFQGRCFLPHHGVCQLEANWTGGGGGANERTNRPARA